jgi:nucleoside-diphosphate-sugar epimerase
MHISFRLLLVALTLLSASPAHADKTSPAQEMAKPGESTEPPKPRGAPVAVVSQLELPRAGGVLIFGAAGVGVDLVKALVAKANHVTVVTNNEKKTRDLTAAGATVMKANMADPESLKAVFTSAPFRVVISTVGQLDAKPTDAADNKNAIDATKTAGLERFIMLSRIGVGDSAVAPPWYVRLPMNLFSGKALAADKAAEDYLRTSGLEYTIVRIGGLTYKPADDTAVLTTDSDVYSQVTKADLAALLVTCADDTTAIRKTFSAYDPSRTGFLSLFGKREVPKT